MSRSKKDRQPLWRPNFVDQSELPDIKAIRTDFIINFIAVALVLFVTFYLLQREYNSYALGKAITGMETRIRLAEADDAEKLKLSESFRKSARYIVEVDEFFNAPLKVHGFLYDLSEIKPVDLIFNSISLKESVAKKGNKQVVSYGINITGDAENLTVLDNFKKTLGESELLKIDGFDLEIDESLEGRDAKTGIFPFRLSVSLVPAKGGAS